MKYKIIIKIQKTTELSGMCRNKDTELKNKQTNINPKPFISRTQKSPPNFELFPCSGVTQSRPQLRTQDIKADV